MNKQPGTHLMCVSYLDVCVLLFVPLWRILFQPALNDDRSIRGVLFFNGCRQTAGRRQVNAVLQSAEAPFLQCGRPLDKNKKNHTNIQELNNINRKKKHERNELAQNEPASPVMTDSEELRLRSVLTPFTHVPLPDWHEAR